MKKAFIKIAIRELLFYLVATKQDIINRYENYPDNKLKDKNPVFTFEEAIAAAIPTELEMEAHFIC